MKKIEKLAKQRYDLTLQKIKLEATRDVAGLSANESATLTLVLDKINALTEKINSIKNKGE